MDKQKKSYPSLLETVGQTPLVKINYLTKGLPVEIWAKLEFFNPMGSIKDRIALYMVEKSEKDGHLKPGATIIDNSSGNTALGLAMVCGLKGYHLKIVVRDSISPEKLNFLQALGVDIIKVDHTLPPESPESYNNITPRLAQEIPNCYYLDQHNNRDNNECHYRTTAPEIWEQMQGKIDYFVAGIGTGGTISGIGRYLKEKDPRIKVIGVDPVGSVFFDYFYSGQKKTPQPYLIEGLGDEFIIGCVEFDVIDEIYQVSDREAFLTTRKLVAEESILAGGSSGAALWACLKLAHKLPERNGPVRIVTVFPDSANRYLSTIFNNSWLKEKKII